MEDRGMVVDTSVFIEFLRATKKDLHIVYNT